jgi:hypothetical protein
MAEFALVDVEVGNELFWYIFDGGPFLSMAISTDENTPASA